VIGEAVDMDPRQLLRDGDLQGARTALMQEVRASPRDPKLRTFLFQMFCVTGEWERALTQLSVVAEFDKLALPMAQAYQMAIRCEVLREKVFRGERMPTVFGDPGDWVPLLIEANRLLASNRPDEAARLRDEALERAPENPGVLNGIPCGWIADADPRLGPVLEVYVDGRYFWVPFMRVREMHLEPPEDLRDQVWMPARFIWSNQGEAVGFVPTRYPGSATAKNPAIAMSRLTEWHDVGEDWSLPLGQRMLVSDSEDVALMDVRQLTLEPSADGQA